MTWQFVLFLLSVVCLAISILVVPFPPRPEGMVARVPWFNLGVFFFVLVFCLEAAPK